MTYNSLPFFVISGADGVGKTTTTELTEKILSKKGISVLSFHHMLKEKSASPSDTSSNQKGSAKRPEKAIWKSFIPSSLKMLVTSIRDEYKYMARINNMLRLARANKQIALCDRYVYDRLITIRLKKRPLLHKFAVRIVCTLLQKPTLTVIITEYPEIIRARRQELSKSEIVSYQSNFISLCHTINAPLHILSANQRAPEFIAEELSEIIISSLHA
tara:strand:- start:975 stop:1622 length:648 start_codon:yes stop_codon:yes gene_type:complete